jgi:hypothetical protein
LNSGFCFDFCCSINLWIGPWYASLDIDSAPQEAQLWNLFSVLPQILGSCPVKTMNRFRSESGCEISQLLTNHFSLSRPSVCPLWMTLKVRENPLFMENVESHHPMSKSIASSADGTEDQTISTDSMEVTLISPNPVYYPRRAQTLSLFPHIRFNQWKLAYLLSRADFIPSLTFRWRFIFRLALRCHGLFQNFGAQSYSTRPPICPIWEMLVNVG